MFITVHQPTIVNPLGDLLSLIIVWAKSTIKGDEYSHGHCYNGWGMIRTGIRHTMQGVVRHRRNVVLPVLLARSRCS